jgi:hypothetical protein
MSTVVNPQAPSAPVVSPSAPATRGSGTSVAPSGISPIAIPVWGWIIVALAVTWVCYAYAGVHIFPNAWEHMHEFLHDSRHFMGIPCH